MTPPNNRDGRPPQRSQQPSRRPAPTDNRAYSPQKSVHSDPRRQPQHRTSDVPPRQKPVPTNAHRQAPPPQYRPPKTDHMQKSYIAYKKKERLRKKIMRISFIVFVLAILVIIILLLSRSCSKGNSGEQNNADKISENSTNQTSVIETSSDKPKESSVVSDAASSKPESSKENSKESSKESETSSVDNPHHYTTNYSRFSQDVMNELEENITSEFVALYDVTTDEVIFSHNYSKKCFPASTTKLLTAITASSIITDPNTVITVGDEIRMIGADSSSAYLQEGMQLTFEMLLDALLLPSGNDAAYTIAVNCAKIYKNDKTLKNEEAVKQFMELVNKKAKQIGASRTHYVTPDGWHDDNHYTCAQDLIKIGDYAKSIPIVSKSCSKAYVEWDLVKGGSIAWSNSNKLIQWDSGVYSEYCDGLKTGFTDEAGSSVVASATMNGHTFIAVTMNGLTLYTKYEDCNLMFKKAFELYGLNYTYG